MKANSPSYFTATSLFSVQRFAQAPEQLVQQIGEWSSLQKVPAVRRGLYVVTADGGAEASIDLWKEALAQGPDFASPRVFPWTLASSAAGFLAKQLDLQGPNYTLIGAADALCAAFGHALSDLEAARIDYAVLVVLELGMAEQMTRIAAMGLNREGDSLELSFEEHPEISEEQAAFDMMAAICKDLQMQQKGHHASPTEGQILVYASGE